MKTRTWILALAALAVVGCASPVVAEMPTVAPTSTAAPTSYPCDGRRWEQAQSIIVGPADGIRATIAPTDQALFPCLRFGELTGSSSVFVNLSHYDRRYQEGGELIQLGIDRGTGEPEHFMFTSDNTGGIGIAISSPQPEAGVAYTLSIELLGHNWVLRIADNHGTIWTMDEQAHWTDPQSAWVMAETYDHSLVRGILVSDLNLSYSGVFSSASFANCPSIAIAPDGHGVYATRPSDGFSCLAGNDLVISSAD